MSLLIKSVVSCDDSDKICTVTEEQDGGKK